MDIRITFPGGKKVNAELGLHTVQTDQSEAHGGQGTAPEPFDLFLASLGTCAGIYVLGFCQARNLPTTGIELTQRNHFDEATHTLTRVELDVVLPDTFPEKYRVAIVRAAEGCRVKKLLSAPPQIAVRARIEKSQVTGSVLAAE
jgi:putative redox protein